MRKVIFLITFLILAINLYSFPLKKIKLGDIINIKELQPINAKGESYKDLKEHKLIFLWRYDKRLSKKSAKKFIKVCKERKIICISIETKGIPMEKQIEFLVDVPENVYFAKNISPVQSWGIFTLPVTIFLDKSDKVIHAVGYEGQYITKIERYLDYLEGKISKKELNKIENESPSYKRSVLPDLNYILKLISENQKEDAEKKLIEISNRLKLSDLNITEKIDFIKVLVKLNKFQKAEKVINSLNKYNPHVKFFKAIILFKKNQLDNALKLLKEIEMIYPNKKALYYFIGKIYKLKGDYKNAAEYYDKVFNYINISF